MFREKGMPGCHKEAFLVRCQRNRRRRTQIFTIPEPRSTTGLSLSPTPHPPHLISRFHTPFQLLSLNLTLCTPLLLFSSPRLIIEGQFGIKTLVIEPQEGHNLEFTYTREHFRHSPSKVIPGPTTSPQKLPWVPGSQKLQKVVHRGHSSLSNCQDHSTLEDRGPNSHPGSSSMSISLVVQFSYNCF